MAKERFVACNFRTKSRALIAHANTIIAEYQAQGFTLTLRQLYYQFVSRDLLPNKQSEYKKLGSVINDARLAGLIDWSAIEDRTRYVRGWPSWDDPADALERAASAYKEDLWRNQKYAPEIWIEKDALIGVIEPACARHRLDFFACRGYTSQSEQFRAGKRFADARRRGKTPIVFHLGDHDPSGIDMTRDNADRLTMFARHGVTVRRLALNMNQVRQYDPPPNPAKDTDSRSPDYIAKFGDSSWELDALEPTVIDGLINAAVASIKNGKQWAKDLKAEVANRDAMTKTADKWPDVSAFLDDMESD